LQGADLRHADLQGADLVFVKNLQTARLGDAILNGAKLDEETRQRLKEMGIIKDEDEDEQPDDESSNDET